MRPRDRPDIEKKAVKRVKTKKDAARRLDARVAGLWSTVGPDIERQLCALAGCPGLDQMGEKAAGDWLRALYSCGWCRGLVLSQNRVTQDRGFRPHLCACANLIG